MILVTEELNKINLIERSRKVKDFFSLFFGVGMASIGLKGFLLPNSFLDGGAMGIALLSRLITGLDLSLLIVLVNLPFLIMAKKQISKIFAVKSALAILFLAVLVHLIELPNFTDDKLLISVFGGFFLGAGIGLSIRGGGVIDGTEVLAITISKKSILTVGDFIAIFNIVLFSCAAFLINLETAMYSILTYISASKTVDFIINGIDEYIGVMIITNKNEEMKYVLMHEMGRGLTVFKSDEGYGSTGSATKEKEILFNVVTRLEVTKLLTEIKKIDETAFIIQIPIRDTRGGMVKKRPLY